MPELRDPIGQAQLDPMQAASNAAQANPLQAAVAMGAPLADSGYNPLADAAANPNGAITAANNPGAFNSQGDMIRAPAVTGVTPASVTRDDRGNVIATTPAKAQYAPAAGLHSSAPVPPAPPPGPAGPASPVVPYAPPATPGALPPARNPLQAQAAGGPAFDPFANQKLAAKGEEGALLNRKLGVAAGGGMRDEALGAAGAENARYAQEAEHAARMQRAEAAKLDKRHEDLIKSEGARDLVAEYWKNKGLGGSSLAFISAAAGGFLQGWRGLATNPGLDNLNKDIDRHIQASQENSQLKINADKTLYDHFRDKTHDANEARALTHAATLDSLGADLEKARAGTRDQEEIGHIDDHLQSVRMQTARWRDEAKAAAVRSNAPKTTEQLLALGKGAAEIEHLNAETEGLRAKAAAAGAPPGAGVAQDAARDLQRQAAANGGEIPGTGPVDRALAGASHEGGVSGAAARFIRGESAMAADTDKYNVATQAMQVMNPHMRPSPQNVQAFLEAQGLTHGSPEQQTEAMARLSKIATRRPGNPLQAQAAGADDEPESFAAP